MSGPSNEEQYYLELINDARLDPLGNAARYISSYSPLTAGDAGVQSAISFFGVSGAALLAAYKALQPVAPLAWNDTLGGTALAHNQAMIAADDQQHQLPGELDLGTRITNAGYTGWNALGENIYAYASNTLFGHAGFMIDWGPGQDGMQTPPGHRDNIMSATYTEVGIGVTLESNPATNVGPQLVTEDFGTRRHRFILGVAYSDGDHNAFYTPAEGRGDLTVTLAGNAAASTASGGYALDVTGLGAGTVGFSGGGLAGPASIALQSLSANVKLDVVDGNTLRTSASGTVSGFGRIVALGAGGLSLTAGAGDQTIVGNAGRDTLNGGAGNDTLDGGAGNDIAVYAAARSAATVTHDAAGHKLVIAIPGEGTDAATRIEQFQFADGLYSFNFGAAATVLANFGGAQGWTSDAVNTRRLADVNGDGKLDIVGFGFSAVRVALGNGDGTFQAAKVGVANFGPAQDWDTQDHYPRLLADVNGDGRADIVGFGYGGVFTALGKADGTFADTQAALANFGGQLGWTSQNVNLRLVADVNGDGKADILGFGFSAVRVALGNGDGTFQAAKIGIADFGPSLGWTNQDQYSRQLADVNGDGKLDLVGFGGGAVFTALGNGDGTFQASHIALADMSTALGWTSQSAFPRTMADVNGDGRADIVGFGYGGASVALARADGTFDAASLAVAGFGTAQGWTSQDATPRYLTDINHDGKLDILGFGPDGTAIAYGNGDGTFSAVSKDLANFGNTQGWTSNDANPHLVADLNGDGLPDVLGFAFAGVKVAMNQWDVVL